MHGTLPEGTRNHPALDLDFWIRQFPISEDDKHGCWIASPSQLARLEQIRRLVQKDHDLGEGVPVDVFVWQKRVGFRENPWLTRIGGQPWRESDKPWPMGADNHPLTFIGQICFIDSMDLFAGTLPGDVLLIFTGFDGGYLDQDDGLVIEWSNLKLKQPYPRYPDNIPRGGKLPFEFEGVIHRTNQFPESRAIFDKLGYEATYWLDSYQATLIGAHASIPQGWPFEQQPSPLIAMLSAFLPSEEWPLCNVSSLPFWMSAKGGSDSFDDWCRLSIHDLGCLFFYRGENGQIKHADASF